MASWIIDEALATSKGALAVVSALAAPPFFPANLPSVILTGVEAGLQIAAVTAAMPKAPSFASGVTNFAGGMALVGEAGPELLHLPSGTNVYNNQQTQNIMNSGGEMHFHVHSPQQMDIAQMNAEQKHLIRQLKFQGVV